MNQEELKLALQRHATSKILTSEDLGSVRSLGFRGEALPSIASVSKMTLSSRGTIEVEAGKILEESSRQVSGTQIEVRSLFFNTPVRRKFQKSIASEVAAIHKLLIRLALCHPQIHFRWINEGEEKLIALRGDDLEQRISSLLGIEFVQKQVDARADGMKLCGFIGGHRANRTGQHLFVNGRFVLSPFISTAVLEGVATRIAMGRFPQFVLHLDLPSDFVDVNVHPQKKEVRFSNKDLVADFVRRSVDEALQIKPQPIRFEPTPKRFDFPQRELPVEEPLFEKREIEEPAQLELRPLLHALTVVGGYFLHRVEEGVAIVDLNAARSLLMGQSDQEISVQKLLLPLMIELDPEIVEEKLSFLEGCGFSLRPFGGTTFACDAIPAHIEQEEANDVIDQLLAGRSKKLALKKRRFTLEEAKRLTEELIASGLIEGATSLLSEQEIERRFGV